MKHRSLLIGLAIATALVAGYGAGTRDRSHPGPTLGPTPAFAEGAIIVPEGETFVSTDGGHAYLWRRDGERIVLLGECARTLDGPQGQATFVWLPGVERRS